MFEVSAMKATPISPEQRLEELRQNSADASMTFYFYIYVDY